MDTKPIAVDLFIVSEALTRTWLLSYISFITIANCFYTFNIFLNFLSFFLSDNTMKIKCWIKRSFLILEGRDFILHFQELNPDDPFILPI